MYRYDWLEECFKDETKIRIIHINPHVHMPVSGTTVPVSGSNHNTKLTPYFLITLVGDGRLVKARIPLLVLIVQALTNEGMYLLRLLSYTRGSTLEASKKKGRFSASMRTRSKYSSAVKRQKKGKSVQCPEGIRIRKYKWDRIEINLNTQIQICRSA